MALASMRLGDQSNIFEPGGDFTDYRCCGVCAAIVDNDNLPRIGLAGEIVGDLREGVTDTGFFVKCRYDDRE